MKSCGPFMRDLNIFRLTANDISFRQGLSFTVWTRRLKNLFYVCNQCQPQDMVALIAEMLMDSIIHGKFVLRGIGTFFRRSIIFDFLGSQENVVQKISMNQMSKECGLKMSSLSMIQYQLLQNLSYRIYMAGQGELKTCSSANHVMETKLEGIQSSNFC